MKAPIPIDRPLRNHRGLVLIVQRPAFQRLPDAAKKVVEMELRARKMERRAA